MKIKNLETVNQAYNNFSNIETSLFKYNNIDENKIEELFPDIVNDQNYTEKSYVEYMEQIDKGSEFVDYILNHKDKKYCIVGDYDCDGIMATSILCFTLANIGCDVTFTIPDRFTDGYGMHKRQVDIAIENAADVIITVDNGIVANDAIDYAHSKGLYVIITDHHTPQDKCNGDIVIDPLYNNDKFKGISGATVAFKLAYLLLKANNDDEIYNSCISYLQFMAATTVYSDVMPMFGENRKLVTDSINYANQNQYDIDNFINKICRLTGFYSDREMTRFRAFNKNNIDFYFVPVINACNRVLGDVSNLVFDIMTLLYNENSYPVDIGDYPAINKKRMFMKSELIRKHVKNDYTNAVVETVLPDMWDENYSGIVGLVASDIVDTENKPALIGITPIGETRDENIVKFSGRSVDGFNLFEALSKIKEDHPDLKLAFGGHAEALGAACLYKDIPVLQKYISDMYDPTKFQKSTIVYNIDSTNVNSIISLYRKFQPFGNKFMFPKFYITGQVKYINKEISLFFIDNIKTGIKYYSKELCNKLFGYMKDKSDIECIVSILEDNDGDVLLKLDKIL